MPVLSALPLLSSYLPFTQLSGWHRGMLLCPSCEADARAQVVAEKARLLASAKRAVILSSVGAVLLLVFIGCMAMVASLQPDLKTFGKIEVLLALTLSCYVTWSGFWGWSPVYRAFKTSMERTGCLLLATPLTWLFLILVVGMVLFVVAECYGACGIAIARHRKAARIAHGHLPPQPF